MKKYNIFIGLFVIISLFCLGGEACAQAQVVSVVPTKETSSLSLWAAFVGALSALLTTFVKDLWIARSNERNAKNLKQHDIFRNYAAPLIASNEKLLWRFSEIYIDKRHHFLKTATLPLVYNEYKRKSTLYRIACILGWIRAINLELNSLPKGASGFLGPVLDAIGKFQSALADGPHVELHRLQQFCAVWGINLPVDEKNKKN